MRAVRRLADFAAMRNVAMSNPPTDSSSGRLRWLTLRTPVVWE